MLLANGDYKIVNQLQTNNWQDFSAPEGTKVLRDTVQKVRELSRYKHSIGYKKDLSDKG